MKENDMHVQFPNAEFLELEFYDCRMLDVVVLDMFPKLKTLTVYQGHRFTYYDEEVVHITMVDACNSLASAKMTSPSPSLLHLKTFEFTLSMCDPSIIPAIQILLENAPILERVVIRLRQQASDVETFLFAQEKVLSMPRSSPTAQVIISLIDT
ncbi:uncharacterized protein LOC131024698 isoform X2 [Salvia miltiorrhiza]|uniref:uncharacterized protein LOC131024698 isoform X2 n=1 Tax=Salvia miltiorrhiza TaxID=226208 RepID=UPI0025AC3473|nr:uncharacterized protein LOC131024698 isoform X2 [Salvia miltiorrhiza]